MRFEITLRVTTPDGEMQEREVIVLDKGHDRHEATGLSIEEGKALLKSLQHKVIEAQAEAFCASKSVCPDCRRRLRRKGTHSIGYRTVFGDIPVTSPRYYQCACEDRHPKTFSPLTDLLPDHTAPELLWLETKWSSLVSFGAATDLLKDVLPIGESLNAETVRDHLHKAARRMEGELADEQSSFIETCPRDRVAMPLPEGPITVGIDGGYVRSREKGQPHFEVMVAKSMPADRPNRYLGLVHAYDIRPRRRLHDVLKEQGWQENQPVTFLTDGGDTWPRRLSTCSTGSTSPCASPSCASTSRDSAMQIPMTGKPHQGIPVERQSARRPERDRRIHRQAGRHRDRLCKH